MKQSGLKVSFYLKKSEMSDDGLCPVMGRINVGRYSEAAFSAKLSASPKLKNSARSLLRSGWRLISIIGSRMVEICTGPPVLRDGNLISGLSIRTILFFGTGIVTAGCAAVMIACLIVVSSGLSARLFLSTLFHAVIFQWGSTNIKFCCMLCFK